MEEQRSYGIFKNSLWREKWVRLQKSVNEGKYNDCMPYVDS